MKDRFNLTRTLLLVLPLILFLSSCADVIPIDECLYDEPYGFLGGLWHGIIAPFSFVGSLFFDDIAMYAVNNNGNWYNFGFVIGAGILFGGSSKARRKRC